MERRCRPRICGNSWFVMTLVRFAQGFAERERSRLLAGHRVERNDSGFLLRELSRFGSGLAFVAARATSPGRGEEGLPVPPGRPHSGWGSSERYINDGAVEHASGSAREGDRVWWFVPERLLNGASAPVVVYLHGFRASAPDLYWEHIHHLTRQGYVVIFPRINKGGALGMFTDNDQPGMLTRAIEATRVALAELGGVAELDRLYLFGHSLGGLIASCWMGYNGPNPAGIVLAHPSISMDRIPEFARRFITPADWRTLVSANTAPTIILGGDRDSLVPPDECRELGRAMTQTTSCVGYITRHDEYGAPPIPSGHLATVRSDSASLRWLGHLLGGNEGDDSLHSRFYYAALDALICGETELTFDMGRWSDGTPVTEPTIEVFSESESDASREAVGVHGGGS